MEEVLTFNASKLLKTYPKVEKTALDPIKKPKNTGLQSLLDASKREPLTTKDAVKFLLEGSLKSKVCRYCLNIASELSELDQILQVADKGTLYKVTIKDMIASFHPFKVADDPNFPDKICDKCLDRTLTSYLFTQQCEQAERALWNCFEDMYQKLDKLDSLERTRKRGRQKLNPNYNTLYAEHNKVINYAEPKMHIVNTASVSLTEQSAINEFECLKCCQVLPNLESLLKHTKTHPKSMWYNCRLCGASFPKLHKLKKHFNSGHKARAPPRSTDGPTKFDCKTCGNVSENYNTYLQHIEKHKFKMVMQHLVDRKLDKLCSICFNKGSDMIQLDNTICLHGGCAELTGDRTLYTILASTLPEKKNKYQELLVPTQANTMRFLKKKNKDRNGPDFPLSNPRILTVEEIDCNDCYIFFFSEPQMLKSDNITEIDDDEIPTVDTVTEHIDEKDKQDPNNSVGIEAKNNESTLNAEIAVAEIVAEHIDENYNQALNNVVAMETKNPESIEFDQDNPLLDDMIDNQFDQPKTSDKLEKHKFSKTDYGKIEDYRHKIDDPKNPKDSEENWIFNQSFVEHSNDAKNVVLVSVKEICNYCWVFNNLEKCDHCKKSNDPTNNSIETSAASQNIGHSTPGITTTNNLKDTKMAYNDTSKDKPTWQCYICLINNNKDRKTCDCCEAKPLLNVENNHFKFNQIIGKQVELNKNVLETDADSSKFDFPLSFDFKVAKESQPCDNITVNNNITANNDTKALNIEPEILLMETETVDAQSVLPFSDSFTSTEHEAMDIEEIRITDEISHPNNETCDTDTMSYELIPTMINVVSHEPPPINNMTFMANQFQFAIGSGSRSAEKAPRKYKRALRNTTRASHK